MKKKFSIGFIGFSLIVIFILINGCATTEPRIAKRTPPPTPSPQPPPSPQPTPPPVSTTPKPVPTPEPTPVPVQPPKTKTPAKPPVRYVVIQAPVSIMGTSKIDLLERPNPKSQVIMKIESGTRLELLTIQGTWMKVKTHTGKIGWISTSYMAK